MLISAPRALRWAMAVWSAGVDEAPVAVVHDLGFVLLRGRGVRFCAGRDRAFSASDGSAVDVDMTTAR